MKVSITGLLLSTVCGSALAAPTNFNTDAGVDVGVDAGVKTGVKAGADGVKVGVDGGKSGVKTKVETRDIVGNTAQTLTGVPKVPVVGGLAGLDGLEKQVEDILAQANIAGRDIPVVGQGVDINKLSPDVQSLLKKLSPEVQALFANVGQGSTLLNSREDAGPLAGVEVPEELQALLKELGLQVRGQVLNADVNVGEVEANVNVKVNVDDDDVLRRSVFPQDTVKNAIANADSTVNKATSVDPIKTANSISPETKVPVNKVVAALDGAVKRDLVNDVAGPADATGALAGVTPEVSELLKKLEAALSAAPLTTRDVVGDATGKVESTVTPEVSELLKKLEAALSAAPLTTRDIVGDATGKVESAIPPEASELLKKLEAALSAAPLTTRDIVGDATGKVESAIPPEASELLKKLEAALSAAPLTTRDVVGDATGKVESTVKSAGIDASNALSNTEAVNKVVAAVKGTLAQNGSTL